MSTFAKVPKNLQPKISIAAQYSTEEVFIEKSRKAGLTEDQFSDEDLKNIRNEVKENQIKKNTEAAASNDEKPTKVKAEKVEKAPKEKAPKAEKVVKEKVAKEPKPKKEKVVKEKVVFVPTEDQKAIIDDETISRSTKIRKLHVAGLTNSQIVKVLDTYFSFVTQTLSRSTDPEVKFERTFTKKEKVEETAAESNEAPVEETEA